MRVVFLGLSNTSSWGVGHATNHRALVRELSARGHEVLFCERDGSPADLAARHSAEVAAADLVVVCSDIKKGQAVCRWVLETARGGTAFYDLETPLTLDDLRRGECEYLSPDLIGRFDLFLSSTGGPTLEVLEEEFGARRAVAFYSLVDTDVYEPVAAEMLWDLGYLGAYEQGNQLALERLLIETARRAPLLSFAVAGPQYPPEIEWPDNVERIEHVEPGDAPAFYSAQRFTLNITEPGARAAGWTPSARLFESAACETPVISDRWEGLGQIFAPDEEILIADSAEDVIDFLTEIGEDERAALGGRARQRVLAEHTAERRCEQLEEEVAGTRAG
jgi:spore maturation protein CgeB